MKYDSLTLSGESLLFMWQWEKYSLRLCGWVARRRKSSAPERENSLPRIPTAWMIRDSMASPFAGVFPTCATHGSNPWTFTSDDTLQNFHSLDSSCITLSTRLSGLKNSVSESIVQWTRNEEEAVVGEPRSSSCITQESQSSLLTSLYALRISISFILVSVLSRRPLWLGKATHESAIDNVPNHKRRP